MQTRFTHRFLAGAAVAVCAAALVIAKPASAQSEAITGFTSTNAFQLANFTVGYTFSLSSSVNVTSLGYFDYQANGLAEAHAVGIYNNAGTLLFSATVPTGTGGTLGSTFTGAGGLVSGFRYTALGASQTLGAGTYTIGAYSGNLGTTDAFFYNATGTTTSSPVTYIAGVAASSPGGLSSTAPVGGGSGQSYFGPSFQFTAGSSVNGPEPGTMALFGTGLVSMGGVALRRRKKAAK